MTLPLPPRTRRLTAAAAVLIGAGPASGQSESHWTNCLDLSVEGRGWTDTKSPYDRLPSRAQGKVRAAVWSLSQYSSGIAVRFVSDATRLEARWTLTNKSLQMNHMPSTGVSGLDLYARRGDGSWQWLAVGRPTELINRATLADGLPEGRREYLLYLPLYNGVQSLEIGVPEGAALEPAPARPADHRPLVFYGTSITQGACASRPGMCHPAILGRLLDRPVINLGFSGNGRMEPEVVHLIAELEACVYVIDCLPNMNAGEIAEKAPPLVRHLREAHPDTPIVLVEDRTYANAALLPALAERNRTNREALKEAFDLLVAEGVTGLTYLPGDHLLGGDGEATVDGSHPTDLGFARQAEVFYGVLAPLLLGAK